MGRWEKPTANSVILIQVLLQLFEMFRVAVEYVGLVGTDEGDASIETASILLILLIIILLHYGVIFMQNCYL